MNIADAMQSYLHGHAQGLPIRAVVEAAQKHGVDDALQAGVHVHAVLGRARGNVLQSCPPVVVDAPRCNAHTQGEGR
jgi:hypothetical protein